MLTRVACGGSFRPASCRQQQSESRARHCVNTVSCRWLQQHMPSLGIKPARGARTGVRGHRRFSTSRQSPPESGISYLDTSYSAQAFSYCRSSAFRLADRCASFLLPSPKLPISSSQHSCATICHTQYRVYLCAIASEASCSNAAACFDDLRRSTCVCVDSTKLTRRHACRDE